MSENKTRPTRQSSHEFIAAIDHPTRHNDALTLLRMHQDITGYEPVMWGPSIIGFDSYHYVYASGREGDMCAAGFSPRRSSLVLYVSFEFAGCAELLAQLGKHKASKSCLYINTLADVHDEVLREIIQRSYEYVKSHYHHTV
ncbi:DUF1801 domain-containing protein [Timonella sp. A28]|uniref:DUF1801 domain-containing protein n=1 Tax=Timonella sp. A28 TaxID=3442640 RepID=UPI003EBFF1BB